MCLDRTVYTAHWTHYAVHLIYHDTAGLLQLVVILVHILKEAFEAGKPFRHQQTKLQYWQRKSISDKPENHKITFSK